MVVSFLVVVTVSASKALEWWYSSHVVTSQKTQQQKNAMDLSLGSRSVIGKCDIPYRILREGTVPHEPPTPTHTHTDRVFFVFFSFSLG